VQSKFILKNIIIYKYAKYFSLLNAILLIPLLIIGSVFYALTNYYIHYKIIKHIIFLILYQSINLGYFQIAKNKNMGSYHNLILIFILMLFINSGISIYETTYQTHSNLINITTTTISILLGFASSYYLIKYSKINKWFKPVGILQIVYSFLLFQDIFNLNFPNFKVIHGILFLLVLEVRYILDYKLFSSFIRKS